MKTISSGKYLNLWRCTINSAGFSILALDHRNNLRRIINPSDPDSVKDEVLSSLKIDITTTISKYASAILLDPEVGVFQLVAKNLIPKNVGLIVALESTGYTGNAESRESNILDNWSVSKTQKIGANAVKLLVYYHPDSPTATNIESLVGKVCEECNRMEIPFILEILTYSIDKNNKLYGIEKKDLIIESARKLSRIGCDMLKMEFPCDYKNNQDFSQWAKSCKELTSACEAPWVLLSASVGFQTFLKQVSIACESGAVGIAVGRAVWKEAVLLHENERINFLNKEASERLFRLTSLVSALSRKFTEVYKVIPYSYKYY